MAYLINDCSNAMDNLWYFKYGITNNDNKLFNVYYDNCFSSYENQKMVRNYREMIAVMKLVDYAVNLVRDTECGKSE